MKKTIHSNAMRIVLAILVCLFLCNNNAAKAQTKIAVMDFNTGVGVDQSMVSGLSDMLINSLFDTGKFQIVERNQINQVIKEHGFQSSSLSMGQIAQVGKILGVSSILVGTVNYIAIEKEYNIDVRIVDVESGVVISAAGVTKTVTTTYRDLMQSLTKELAEKIPARTLSPTPVPQLPQSIKIGYTDSNQIISQMAEYDQMQNILKQFTASLEAELSSLHNQFNTKLEDYQRTSKILTDINRRTKEEELQVLAQTREEFEELAQQKLQAKQRELLDPIIQKLQRAIEAVGNENNFLCIFDIGSSNIPYKGKLVDANKLIKNKLEIYR